MTSDLLAGFEREVEGRGFLNARYTYPVRRQVGFLSAGVLLEMGSRGGPLPNQRRTIRSMMSEAADVINPVAAQQFRDLPAFEVVVLAPARTLAEKLAFLHHRATVKDVSALTAGARHLYDVAMLLSNSDVCDALSGGVLISELMVDIDARSEVAGWRYTERPNSGFAGSPAFNGEAVIDAALRRGYDNLGDLVWGHLPTYDQAIEIIQSQHKLI